MVFKKEYLVDELDLPCEAIKDNIIETSRWSELHEIVFKNTDGKHYKTSYSCGSTEQQDESPWEYDDDVTCHEVEQKEITIWAWERI